MVLSIYVDILREGRWSIWAMKLEVISEERLGKYLQAAGFNQQRALALYGWNILISESFYPVLSAVEVSLRNIIVTRLIDLYGEKWWENHALLSQIGKGRGKITGAVNKLKKEGAVTSGRMTAELTFGFWVNMLLPRHENTIWKDLRSDFADLPPSISYNQLSDRCETVCQFRNRIFHHEPVFHTNISQEYSQTVELLRWLSGDKAVWIKGYSRVMRVLREKP